MNKEQIAKDAKKIMDEFIEELEGVKLTEDFGVERKADMRTSFDDERDEGFRERMLKNAPSERKGFIVAEKKSW